MKKIQILLVLALVTALILPCLAQEKTELVEVEKIPSIRGTIKKINPGAGTIDVTVSDSKETKIVKVDELTKMYRKMRPKQLEEYELKAKLSDFQVGDTIVVTSDNISGNLIKATKIWEIKAFLLYFKQIQSEVDWAGTITKVNRAQNVLVLKKSQDSKEVQIRTNHETKFYVDNYPATLGDFREGEKISAKLRWLGFEEDQPDVLNCTEIKDAKSYVIQTYRDKIGPILARGKVSEVDMNSKILKIGDESGKVDTLFFTDTTRWIPGGKQKIQKPVDFVGQQVIVFGEQQKEQKNTAVQILHQEAMTSLFDEISSKGSLSGEIVLLGMGEVINIDSSRLSIMTQTGQKIVCQVVPQTVFYQKNQKISPSAIKTGDWVMVRGVKLANDQGVALLVVTFGKSNIK